MFKKEIIAAVTLAATHAIKIGYNDPGLAVNGGAWTTENMVDLGAAYAGTAASDGSEDGGRGLAQTQDDSGMLRGLSRQLTDADAATDDSFLPPSAGGLAQIQDEAD